MSQPRPNRQWSPRRDHAIPEPLASTSRVRPQPRGPASRRQSRCPRHTQPRSSRTPPNAIWAGTGRPRPLKRPIDDDLEALATREHIGVGCARVWPSRHGVPRRVARKRCSSTTWRRQDGRYRPSRTAERRRAPRTPVSRSERTPAAPVVESARPSAATEPVRGGTKWPPTQVAAAKMWVIKVHFARVREITTTG